MRDNPEGIRSGCKMVDGDKSHRIRLELCSLCGGHNLDAPEGVLEKISPTTIFSLYSGRSEYKAGRQEVGCFSAAKNYAGN